MMNRPPALSKIFYCALFCKSSFPTLATLTGACVMACIAALNLVCKECLVLT